MNRKIIIMSVLTLLLIFSSTICFAAENDNALAAFALYIDTSGHYVPGMELLNKALNEVVRYKVNLLMLGSEVQTGNEVLRDLNRCNVTNAADATPEALSEYAAKRHVNNIILFSVRPLDVAIDLKAYSATDNNFFINKTVTRPTGTETMSTLDSLSSMVGDEVTQVMQVIHSEK